MNNRLGMKLALSNSALKRPGNKLNQDPRPRVRPVWTSILIPVDQWKVLIDETVQQPVVDPDFLPHLTLGILIGRAPKNASFDTDTLALCGQFELTSCEGVVDAVGNVFATPVNWSAF